jgi:hypothetical protein
LKLKKAIDNFNWVSLEPIKGSNVTIKPVPVVPIAEKSEKPSAYATKKNWDKID